MARRIARRDVIKATGALAGASALGLSSRSPASAQEVTLRMAWWGSEERHNRTLEALELFSEKNPNLTVDPEITSDYFEKLAVQVAGGNAPDVLQMSGRFIIEYSARGALLDLNPFVPDIIDLSEWDETLTQIGVIDGEMTELPIGLDAYTVLYDKTVLDQIGATIPDQDWTWDEFAAFATDVSEALGEGFYGTTDSGDRYEAFETFLRQREKTLFDADGNQLGFEKEDLIEWWTYWDNLREAGVATSAEIQAAVQGEEQQPIIQGLAPTYFTTSSQFVNHQGLTEHELGLHTLPHSPEGEPGSFVRPALFMSASATTDYPEASAQLIDFLLNDPDAAKILLTARGVPPAPAIRSLVQAEVSSVEQQAFAFIDTIVEISKPQPNILFPPGGQAAGQELLQRLYESIAFGQMTIEEAVDAYFEEAPSLLGA